MIDYFDRVRIVDIFLGICEFLLKYNIESIFILECYFIWDISVDVLEVFGVLFFLFYIL